MIHHSRAARIALFAVTTALCSGLAAPAWAESPHPNLDANGVDLTTGEFSLRLPIYSIGSGQAELPLTAYTGALDNWTQIELEQGVSAGVTTVTIIIGGSSDRFTSADGFAVSKRGTGATLTMNGTSATYRTLEGVTISFSNPNPQAPGGTSHLCNDTSTDNCLLLPTSIDGKSGMTVNYEWDLTPSCTPTLSDPDIYDCNEYWRLRSVSNDAGYAITWAYVNETGSPVTAYFRKATATFSNANKSGMSPVVTYGYPSSGVTTLTRPGGEVWRITGSTLVTGVRRPSASSDTTSVTYAGSVVTAVTNNGIATNYSRSVSGSTATMVVNDALSQTTTVVSDMTKFRPTSVTDALSRTTSYTYDTLGRPTEISYPEGNKVQYTYDARGNVTETRIKPKSGSALSDVVTSASYPSTCTTPSCNSPDSVTDARGNVTDYTYDATTGLPASVTLPAATGGAKRPQTRYTYTANAASIDLLTGVSRCQVGAASDSPSCVGTADEVKTTIAYDANLNTTGVTTAAGDASLSATTAYSYDKAGNLLTADGPLSGTGDTTTFRYDADRRRVGSISADPDGAGSLKRRALKVTYNADGQPTVSELGNVAGTSDSDWASFVSLQQSTASYDTNGFKTKDVLTASSTTYGVTQYSYDALGRIECAARRMNPAYWATATAACTAQTAGSNGPDRIVKASYDAAGQQTKLQSAYGITGVQADEATATYNANGTTATATDAEGNKTSYTYDGVDRLSKATYPSTTKGAGTSNSSDYETLSYDAGGNVTSRRLRDGNSIGYSYDALGRLTAKDLPGSELDVAYTYDLLSRPLTAATSAQTVTLTYDALSRNLTQVGPQGTATSAYDAAGRRTQLTYPGGSFYVTYDYQVTGEVTAIKESGSTSLATIAYDDLGRRTTLTLGNGVVSSYGFDNVSRLTSLGLNLSGTTDDQTLGFSYNPASQIAGTTRSNDGYAWTGAANVTRAYTSNGLNQLTASGATSLGYDTRGNLTTSGSDTYTYSSENLLLTGPGSAVLTYDPLLRLYQTAANGYTTTRFAYDGQSMIAEYNSSNALQKRYVFGPGSDAPLVEYDSSGTKTYLAADERGSVVARTNSSGVATAKNSYDEYGIPGSNTGRFGYTGQAWLPELGMQYSKARIYSPTLGRFMQTDPIGYGDGMNWYNYVGGDPVNWNDPTGLVKKCAVGLPGEVTVCGSGGGDSGGGIGGGASFGVYAGLPTAPNGLVTSDPQEGPEVTVIANQFKPKRRPSAPGLRLPFQACHGAKLILKDGKLAALAGGAGISGFSGTLEDPVSGALYKFTARGAFGDGAMGIGLAIGIYSVTGDINSFEDLMRPFHIDFITGGWGPLSLGKAQISDATNGASDRKIGDINVDGTLSAPFGAAGGAFDGADITQIAPGRCI